MRKGFTKIVLTLFLLAGLPAVGQNINPATQINWPMVTGSGAPTISCTASNFGQPYTDTTNNVQYACSGSGWIQTGAVSKIIAGTNISITPSGGTGVVTINASGGGSSLPTATAAGQIPASTAAGTTYAVQPQIFYSQTGDTIASIEAECSSLCSYVVTQPQTITLTANHTLSNNVFVQFDAGGLWTVNGTGFTLTIPNAVTGSLNEHINSAGTASLALNGVGYKTPMEWFGFVADWNGTTGTDNTAAMQACINAITFGQCTFGGNAAFAGPVSITKSYVGIAGRSHVGRGGGGSTTGNLLEQTSATADGIDVAGTSPTSVAAFGTFENFTMIRNPVPTGTTDAGMSFSFTGGVVVRNVAVFNSHRDFYIHASPSYGGGGFFHNQASWNQGAATTGWTGYYLDAADGNAENSLNLRDDAVGTGSGFPAGFGSTGMLLVGTAINDVNTWNFNCASVTTCQTVDFTGTGSGANTSDIHLNSTTADNGPSGGECLLIENVAAAGDGSVTINDARCSSGQALTYGIDIESSSGISVGGGTQCYGGFPCIFANASNGLSLTNILSNSSATGAITLSGTTGSAVTGNAFTRASQGVLLNNNSNYNTITGNSFSAATSQKIGVHFDSGSTGNVYAGNSFDATVTTPTLDTSGGANGNAVNSFVVSATASSGTQGTVTQTYPLMPTATALENKQCQGTSAVLDNCSAFGFYYVGNANAANAAIMGLWGSGNWLTAAENGNFGVGVALGTAPSYLFQVNGTLAAGTSQQFQVSSAGAVTTPTLNDLTSNTYGVQATALATPAAPSGTASTTGGSLAAGTYNVEIAAVDGLGNTTAVGPSAPFTVASGTTGSIALNWTAVANATSYQIWLTTGVYFTSTSANFTITTASGTSGPIPTANLTGAMQASRGVFNSEVVNNTMDFFGAEVTFHNPVAEIHSNGSSDNFVAIATATASNNYPSIAGPQTMASYWDAAHTQAANAAFYPSVTCAAGSNPVCTWTLGFNPNALSSPVTHGTATAAYSLPSLSGTGTATFTPGAAAQVGTGATVVCATNHVCDSIAGTVELTTGTGTLTGNNEVLQVTLPITRNNNVNCTFSPFSGQSFFESNTTTNSFQINVGATALTASTNYYFSYVCGGN